MSVDEQKSSVYSIQFGSEDAVKTVQAVERLAVVYESTACRPLNKRSISANS
jgi:hypothetical protein